MYFDTKKKYPGQTQSNRQFLHNARPSPITQIRNRKRLFIQIEIQKILIKRKKAPISWNRRGEGISRNDNNGSLANSPSTKQLWRSEISGNWHLNKLVCLWSLLGMLLSPSSRSYWVGGRGDLQLPTSVTGMEAWIWNLDTSFLSLSGL